MTVNVIESSGATACSAGSRAAPGESAGRRGCSTGPFAGPSRGRLPGTVAESRRGPEGG